MPIPNITMKPVESSQLAAIGHDPVTNTLAIRFKSHQENKPEATYHYQGFTAEDFEKFEKADSQGSHFYKNIKGKYEYERQGL